MLEAALLELGEVVGRLQRRLADVRTHVLAERGQQLVEQILARLEVVIERSLRDARALRDQRDRGAGIADPAAISAAARKSFSRIRWIFFPSRWAGARPSGARRSRW